MKFMENATKREAYFAAKNFEIHVQPEAFKKFIENVYYEKKYKFQNFWHHIKQILILFSTVFCKYLVSDT